MTTELTDELQLVADDAAIPPESESLTLWNPLRDEALRIKRTAETLTITGVDDKAGMALARATRFAIRDVRLLIEKKHKELKEPWLEGGRKVDGAKNELLEIIEPMEERLKKMEQFAISEGIRIEDELRKARAAEITPWLNAPLAVDLGKITADEYGEMLAGAQNLREAKLKREADARAESERIAREEAEAREAQRLENLRLREEAEEREKILAAERKAAEAERQRVAEERRKEQEAAAAKQREIEAKAKAEREAAAKKAADELRVQQAAAEAELKKEREAAAERQRVADEAARKERERAADERSKRLAAEQEIANAIREVERKKKATEAAAKEAALAPDVEKLRAYAKDVRLVPQRFLNDQITAYALKKALGGFLDEIEAFAAKLEASL